MAMGQKIEQLTLWHEDKTVWDGLRSRMERIEQSLVECSKAMEGLAQDMLTLTKLHVRLAERVRGFKEIDEFNA